MVRGFLDEAFDVTAGKQRQHHVGLALMLAIVVDGDDIGMVAESSHGLGFSGDAGAGRFIEFLGLDEGKGNVPVENCVVRQEDLLLAAFAEELLDLVATVRKGDRLGGRFSRRPVRGQVLLLPEAGRTCRRTACPCGLGFPHREQRTCLTECQTALTAVHRFITVLGSTIRALHDAGFPRTKHARTASCYATVHAESINGSSRKEIRPPP